jgi:hypothetical protein
MIVYILPLILFLPFYFLRSRNGLGKIIVIFLFFSVFTGNIDQKFSFLLEPSDWVTLFIFLNLGLYSLRHNRKYYLAFRRIDNWVLFYFIFVLLIPVLFNFFLFKTAITFKYFIPIRFYLVYRNLYCLLREAEIRGVQNKINTEYLINKMIFLSFIAAIISLLRYFPVPVIKPLIEIIWPIYYEGKIISIDQWGRLTSSMSGTNGTGNFFAILSIFTLYKVFRGERKFLIQFIIFAICVFLSGSFSSIAAFIVVAFLYSRKYFSFRRILYLIIGVVLVIFVLRRTEIFSKIIEKRIETGYYGQQKNVVLPYNLMARTGYWSNFLKVLYEDQRLLFGLGPGGFFNYGFGYKGIINQNPESYYFRIINESGIFGLISTIIFFAVIFKIIKKNTQKKIGNPLLMNTIKLILYVFLIAGVANETLYYGANTEIFGFILAITSINSRVSAKSINNEF